MPNDGTQPQQPSGTSPPVEQALIPPAVRAMSERADALQREFIAAQTGQAQPQPPAPPVQAQPSVQEQPTNPSPPTAELPIVPPSQRQHEPVPPDAKPPREATDEEIEAVLAMPAEPGSGLALLQHKYRSERGRRQRLQEPDVVPPPPPIHFEVPDVSDDDEPLIDEATRETYGPELADLIEQTARKAAERIAAREVKKVVEPLNKREQQTAAQGQARMLANINRALAPVGITFEQINVHEGFNQWLQLRDPISNAKRHDHLLDAWKAQDGSRVLTIVGAYLDEAMPPPSGQPEVPQPAPAPVAPAAPRQPQVDLMSLAAPGRAPRTEPVTPLQPAPQKPNYTRAQIREFYEAKRKGRYSPADAQAIEADIFAAQQENRIIG